VSLVPLVLEGSGTGLPLPDCIEVVFRLEILQPRKFKQLGSPQEVSEAKG